MKLIILIWVIGLLGTVRGRIKMATDEGQQHTTNANSKLQPKEYAKLMQQLSSKMNTKPTPKKRKLWKGYALGGAAGALGLRMIWADSEKFKKNEIIMKAQLETQGSKIDRQLKDRNYILQQIGNSVRDSQKTFSSNKTNLITKIDLFKHFVTQKLKIYAGKP